MKQHLIALALASLAGSALAGDQTLAITNGATAYFDATAPLLDGGSDTITFTGLAAGTYEFDFSLAGTRINNLAVSVNGQAASVLSAGVFSLASLASTSAQQPFVVQVSGTPAPAQGRPASYTGQLSVSLVPEPETYALFGAGLAAMGYLLRRRRA